jgi:hypothetical protein
MSTVCFLPLAQAVMTLFDCTWQRVPDEARGGHHTLEAEPSLLCYDSNWWTTFFPVAVVAIVFYGGLPVLFN